MISDSKRAAVFSWITGLFSASHVLGNALARFLPESYIFVVSIHEYICWFLCCILCFLFVKKLLIRGLWFQVSIALLIFCPAYMQLFLAETVKPPPRSDRDTACLSWTLKVVHNRFKSMRNAAALVVSRYRVSESCSGFFSPLIFYS